MLRQCKQFLRWETLRLRVFIVSFQFVRVVEFSKERVTCLSRLLNMKTLAGFEYVTEVDGVRLFRKRK